MRLQELRIEEKVQTHNEDLYLSVKERENDDVIKELLVDRYGEFYDNPNDVTGIVWVEHGKGHGSYIIHYNVFNFPIKAFKGIKGFDIYEFVKEIEAGNHEYYTDAIFFRHIESVNIIQ